MGRPCLFWSLCSERDVRFVGSFYEAYAHGEMAPSERATFTGLSAISGSALSE